MKRVWSGEAIGGDVGKIGPAPVQPGGPEILIGGYSPAALSRASRFADGFIAAGGQDPQRMAKPMVDNIVREVLSTQSAVRSAIKSLSEIGANEFVLWPCVPDLEQVDLASKCLD